uniref:Uncharacterized protein n=1 Tax=Musa acuminata subsp. malaccensis TaxID=214687 RepID=A0A804HNB4_MUSAM
MEKGTSDGPWGAMRLLISTPFGELQTVRHRFVLDVTLKSGKQTTILWKVYLQVISCLCLISTGSLPVGLVLLHYM